MDPPFGWEYEATILQNENLAVQGLKCSVLPKHLPQEFFNTSLNLVAISERTIFVGGKKTKITCAIWAHSGFSLAHPSSLGKLRESASTSQTTAWRRLFLFRMRWACTVNCVDCLREVLGCVGGGEQLGEGAMTAKPGLSWNHVFNSSVVMVLSS